MNNGIKYLIIIAFAIMFWGLFLACDKSVQQVLSFSDSNRQELETVLKYYANDTTKLKAAKYLINNMYHASRNEGESIVYDARCIKSEYLINEINAAFNSWECSPWREEIGFEDFCEYILPYRVVDEPLSSWRDSLRSEYDYLLRGIKDPIEAFVKVSGHVLNVFEKTNEGQKHPDVMALHHSLKGTCEQRSLYLVSVLRSLCIPAAYDFVPFWGNYSVNGHAWVAFVKNGRTFTMLPGDSVAKEYNSIDGSGFNDGGYLEHNYYEWDSIKRAPVIMRSSYKIKDRMSPMAENVSHQYGFKNSIKINTCFAWGRAPALMSFHSGYGWRYVITGRSVFGGIKYESLANGVVYLPSTYNKSIQRAIGHPFLFKDSALYVFAPRKDSVQTVVLRRKYPLRKQWYNRWKEFVGAAIEVSNDSLFREKKIVYEFSKVPESIVLTDIHLDTAYRYIRFHAHPEKRPEIAELKFYSQYDSSPLEGRCISSRIEEESVHSLFDNDYLSFSPYVLRDYWVGLDLGAPKQISQFELCPRHDMNMIQRNHVYELFYFDKKWISLGKIKASADSIVYNDVPINAVLWLKNHTEGREERIFLYENGKQCFY